MVMPGRLKLTLYGLVLQIAVPMPMTIMFTAKVESRLISMGRPTTRCTEIQYTTIPSSNPAPITGSSNR